MFGIKIVRQNCKGLVETLGKYSRSVDAGLQFYVPIFRIGYASTASTKIFCYHAR